MALFHKRTSAEMKELMGWSIVLPVGSIEQHGPHLPLDTDSVLVDAIAEEVGNITEVLVLPALVYGVSEEHMGFPGTLTLKPQTFKDNVKDIAGSLLAQGFSHLHILNYHGGNKEHLMALLPELEGMGLRVCIHGVLGRVGKFDHAGEVETSLMLYLFPDRVRVEQIKKFEYKVPKGDGWRTVDYAKEGVIGDATKASAKKGLKYFKKIVSELVKEIEDEERE